MPKIKIEGGHKLSGTIDISGSKNSVVALIPAAILCDEIVEISNVHPPPDVCAHNVPEVFGIHEAHQRVLIRHNQRLVHGIHPLHGKLHRPAAVQDAGRRVDM